MKELFTGIFIRKTGVEILSLYQGEGSSLAQIETLVQELPSIIKQLQIKKW